jgi:hypothetical protein
LLVLGALALVPAASATPVTYSTSGEICAVQGCGDTSVAFVQGSGTLTVAFNALGATVVDPGGPGGFTNASFGSVDISCTGTCTGESLAGLNLFITITQTLPTAGSLPLVAGVLSGSVAVGSSNAEITWAIPNTITIGDFSYRILNNPLALVPPTSNSGVTSIQGRIEEAAIPEPSTYLLLSAGLLGLGIRRRFSAKKA